MSDGNQRASGRGRGRGRRGGRYRGSSSSNRGSFPPASGSSITPLAGSVPLAPLPATPQVTSTNYHNRSITVSPYPNPPTDRTQSPSDDGWNGQYGMSSETVRKQEFLANYAKLLNNATHSDMILRLRSPASTTSLNSEDNVDTSSTFTFYAHLAICSMHTEYFSNAVKHGFREAENSGKATFNFEEYDAEALLWVIKYMYVGDYDVDVDPYEELVLLSNLRDSGSSPHEDEHWQGPLVHPHLGPILIAHARVHRLADMLLMDRLKRLAEYRFNQWIDQTIDLTSPEDNLDYLLELIGQLWINDTNTANLKKAVMRLILSLTSSRSDNIRELLARDDYRTLMRETDLGWEFAEELLNERLMDSLYQ